MNTSRAPPGPEARSRRTRPPSGRVYLSNQPRSRHQAAAAVGKHAVMGLLNATWPAPPRRDKTLATNQPTNHTSDRVTRCVRTQPDCQSEIISSKKRLRNGPAAIRSVHSKDWLVHRKRDFVCGRPEATNHHQGCEMSTAFNTQHPTEKLPMKMCRTDAGNNEARGNRLLYRNPEKCGPKKKENRTKENNYEFIFSSPITRLL